MKDYTFKVANMKKEQSFTLYPYTGGDYIYLQSSQRIMRANLKTGAAIINAKGRENNGFVDLQFAVLNCHLPETIKLTIQRYLWENEGKEGNINGCVFFENKPLFSNKD